MQHRKNSFTPGRLTGIPAPQENLLPHKWTGKTAFFLKDPVAAAPATAALKAKAKSNKNSQAQGSGGRLVNQAQLNGYGRFYAFCCTANHNLGVVGESLELSMFASAKSIPTCSTHQTSISCSISWPGAKRLTTD